MFGKFEDANNSENANNNEVGGTLAATVTRTNDQAHDEGSEIGDNGEYIEDVHNILTEDQLVWT